MKTLTTYIKEDFKLSHKTNVKKNDCTLTYINYDRNGTSPFYHIKIFDATWPEYEKYKDKVYINGKPATLKSGWTPNIICDDFIEVKIRDIDNITDCCGMFDGTRLVDVKKFDTSMVQNMERMFYNCKLLKNVELLDTTNVTNMSNMFLGCNDLNNETHKRWLPVYDFFMNEKRK